MNRKFRKVIIAGNWKMNKTPTETRDFITLLKPQLPKGRLCDVVLCVPSICIPAAVKASKDMKINIGAENCNAEKSGAYTGEVACNMLTDAGCKYVIIGHSERRAMGETDWDVNSKTLAALDSYLTPIICCGETLEQRERGITAEHLATQIKLALRGLSGEEAKRVVIAYEPIWAIGTGRTATPEQAQIACEHIRNTIRNMYGTKVARNISILYGGSMNETNAYDLLAQQDIDGGLIGGAALVVEKFANIIKAANQAN